MDETDFLAKAAEAEEKAERMPDPFAREQMLRIAADWRALARFRQQQVGSGKDDGSDAT